MAKCLHTLVTRHKLQRPSIQSIPRENNHFSRSATDSFRAAGPQFPSPSGLTRDRTFPIHDESSRRRDTHATTRCTIKPVASRPTAQLHNRCTLQLYLFNIN